jgi:epoxyqueuosine reductase
MQSENSLPNLVDRPSTMAQKPLATPPNPRKGWRMIDVASTVAEGIPRMAESEHIPVLGIGPCAGMESQPPGYRPSDLLPGARSMICFGIPVPRGIFQPGPFTTEMVWRTQNLLYRRLDTLSLAFAQALEAQGARAVPVFGCCPMDVSREGRVTGYVDQVRMAELTGIGRKGRNGLLLHRLYGARLMLGGVLTTVDLPAIRIPDIEQPDCPPECRICLVSCPVRAISNHSRRVNVMRCLAYTARTPFMSRLVFAFLCKFHPAAAARFMNRRAFDEHTMHVCFRCVALCPYGEQ